MKNPKYTKDKPKECRYCYWWSKYMKKCIRKKDECYYIQKKPKPKPREPCTGCPYGRVFPCVSFCMKSILKKQQEENDGRE